MRVKALHTCLMVLLFSVSFSMGAAVSVFAQDQDTGDEHQPPSAENIVARMQSKLNLTQDQVSAVLPIIEKYVSKRQDLRESMEDGTADKDNIRSQMKQLKEDEDRELSDFLSPEQLSQWKSMQHPRHRQNSDGQAQHGETEGTGPLNKSEGPGA